MTPARTRLLSFLFFLSGTAGVGYQLVWIRMFTAGLGHEMPALVAVVSAFFGGLALGGWTLDRRVSLGGRPRVWYAALECIIGGWAVASALLIPFANQLALRLAGVQPAPAGQAFVVFALPFLTLLPATVAMGGTLPAMERWLAPFSTDGRCLGRVYALNTAGAVAGVLGSTFLLMPALGLRGTVLVFAGVNFLCGALAFLNRAEAGPVKAARATPQPEPLSARRVKVTVFCTGLLGIGFEVGGVRVLSQVLEGTIYTFAAALSVYLLGTSAGAALWQRLGRHRPSASCLSVLLGGLAIACVAGTGCLFAAQFIYDWSRARLGDALWAVALSEMLVAAGVFGLPTLFMGAVFSHLAQAARREDGGVGRAAALNTLGAALAGGTFGVLLLPALGSKWTLAVASLGYLVLVPTWGKTSWLAAVIALGLFAVQPAVMRLITLPPGARVIDYLEGAAASVAVTQTPDGHRALRVNNRFQMGGTAAALAERRQAHIPLLLHPTPRRALFLGPGTGITLGAASLHPGLVVDGVELVPEVLAMMRHFEPENEGPLPKPGVRVVAADARRFVRTTGERYDVIVADLFHPAQDGAGFLFTREHFDAVRQRLSPGGLFCQWLPMHQLDETSLRAILRAFTLTFSETHAFLLHFNTDIPVLGLVGALEPLRVSPDLIERRLVEPGFRQQMKSAGLDRTINLLGCVVAGPKLLARLGDSAPLSTDDHPIVSFSAPRFTTRRDTRPHELLMRLLPQCRVDPADLLVPGEASAAFAPRLADFIAARDIYLEGLVEEETGRLSTAIDAYLESARRSLYFTPAYARCAGIVQMLAATDKTAARRLYERLEDAQPAQPLGRQMLAPLFEPIAPPP